MKLLAIASLLAAVTAQQCQQVQNVAFSGSTDIGYAVNTTAAGCCSQCGSTQSCAAYTWIPDGGRCFLKTAGLGQQNQAGAVSGTLSGATPSACPFGLVPCKSGATGACALFSDWCATARCSAGSVICPDGVSCSSGGYSGCPNLPAYLNTSSTEAERLTALIVQLDVPTIAAQLNNQGYGQGPPGPPGIEPLAIPPYNWLNEGLHGVARAGLATSFPQISVIGQTWNRTTWQNMGRGLAVEARAKYAMARRLNFTTADYTGVTFYAPNINIGRDPRWGRIQEVPGESPFLTAEYAKAVITSAQAPVTADETTPAIYGCCKHFVAYSFEEYEGIQRSGQNAIVNGRDLLETYLPAFQACLRDAGGKSIMCSYNAVNGVPTCASNFLLNTTARGRYGFDGWIMSDYSAILDTYNSHHYCQPSGNLSAADICIATAMKAGVDQDGGGTDFSRVQALIDEGLLTETDVYTAASRLFKARLELGLLNPPESSPYSDMTAEEWLDTDLHRQQSYEAAQQGMVLLKNDPLPGWSAGPILPLNASRFASSKLAIIGPNADNAGVLVGNYNGTTPYLITPRWGIQSFLGANATVEFQPGCTNIKCADTSLFGPALALANSSDVDIIVGVFGLDLSIEAEGLDRTTLELPGNQLPLLQQLAAIAAQRNVPFLVVLINGGPVNIAWPLSSAAVPGIVLAGYASQSTGTALADILFGAYAPAGKLTVSWFANATTDLPDFADMSMTANATSGSPGRTYRYSTATPLLPFGFGLTYSDWSYAQLAIAPGTAQPCQSFNVTATISNTGKRDSTEVAQLYVSWDASAYAPNAPYPAPNVALAGFERVFVPAGGSAQVTFTVTPRSVARVNGTAASTFGQDFALDQQQHGEVLSGAAFGIQRDYHQASLAAGNGPIGWDDMFALVPGSIKVWVGSGQPSFGAAGVSGTMQLGGSITNLAACIAAQ